MAKSSKKDRFYAAWPTAWGPVGGVWGEKGLRRLILPFYGMQDLRELLAWEHAAAAEDAAPFQALIDCSQRYFNGEAADFTPVEVELPSSLSGKVYRAARQIPPGRTLAYGQLARQMGQPDAARAVASALSRNPTPLVVPCHRVTYSDGRPGGFSAMGGEALKQRLIAHEKRFAG
jgi:methylated-DNA-[protein]-cysteine S-methyltransferase